MNWQNPHFYEGTKPCESIGHVHRVYVVELAVRINTVKLAVEIGSGAYYTPLLAGDTNGTEIIYRFSSPGAADTFVTVVTQA